MTSMAQRFVMWPFDEEVPDSTLGKSNLGKELFQLGFGQSVLGSLRSGDWLGDLAHYYHYYNINIELGNERVY